MKLDHVSIQSTMSEYLIRAQLMETPSNMWRMQFQRAWYGTPNCRRICSEVTLSDNEIILSVNDPAHVTESVDALKRMVVSVGQSLLESDNRKIHTRQALI